MNQKNTIMKNFSLILAMLFFVFTVEAQNVEESKRTRDRKTTKSSVQKSKDKSSKAKTVKPSAKSRSSASRSSRSSSKSSVNQKTKKPSNSSATRSRQERSTRKVSPQTRTSKVSPSRTRTNRSEVNSNASARKANSEFSNRRASNTGSRLSNVRKDRELRSDRGVVYTPKIGARHVASRKVYSSNKIHRVKRKAPRIKYAHRSLDYRRVHNPYIIPRVASIIWNAHMYREYRNWYPNFKLWYYPYGYRIHTISAYDSYNYIGEIARVYGSVTEVWYSRDTREYFLYIGGHYPYQDFTIVLDSRDARRFSWDPVRYFTNRHLTATGLLSVFEDKPEMQIRKRSQISLY